VWSAAGFDERAPHAVEWIDLEETEDEVARRAHERGATVFTRGEGIWGADDAVIFSCTSGGRHRAGQLFRLRRGEDGQPDQLELVVEGDGETLRNPDNLVISPWGEIFVCEDDYSPRRDHLRTIDRDGSVGDFALNRASRGEMAGVCFSPDGRVLFLNIFDPGITLAVTGPFPRV
jgi:secreted PhoX family phosphatase